MRAALEVKAEDKKRDAREQSAVREMGASSGMPLFLGVHSKRMLPMNAPDDRFKNEAERVMRMRQDTVDLSLQCNSLSDHIINQHQQSAGNRAMRHLSANRGIAMKPKLAIGTANDEYEREAERVSEEVKNTPGSTSINTNGASIQQQTSEEKDVAQTRPLVANVTRFVQRAPSDPQGCLEPGSAFEAQLSASAGGSPLPASTRTFMETRFGADFSEVRLHTGDQAAQLNRAINAQAFTHGPDIYLGEGKNDLESNAGKQLLAHELTHVVQRISAEPANFVQRQEDQAAGMTGSSGTSMVAQPPGEGGMSVATPADTRARELIDAALRSGNSNDVQKIKNFGYASQEEKFKLIRIVLNQTWVGPFDEYTLEAIWRSFGTGMIAVASTEEGFKLWQQCVDRGAELEDFPPIVQLREKFLTDIKTTVTGYLFENRQFVIDEMERLGLAGDETAQSPDPTAEQADDMKKMQVAAGQVAKLQAAQEQARHVYVGYEWQTKGMPTGGALTIVFPVQFNPYSGPPLMATFPESVSYMPGIAAVRVETKSYKEVKDLYDKASESITGFLELYPSLYAVSRTGESAATRAFSEIASPAKARVQLGIAMRKLFQDIEATQTKLDKGDLNPLDLTPIHDQLILGGKEALYGAKWNSALPKSIARKLAKDHELGEALKALGLQTAAAALFLLAPFTGGASLFLLLGGGLALTGAKAYMSAAKYEDLAQAARTSVIPGTELVTQGQVDEAKMTAEADAIALALAILTVGVAVAGEMLGAVRGPPPVEGGPPPGGTLPPKTPQNILVVGAERAEEFAYASEAAGRGANVTVVNPQATVEAQAYAARGGNFVQQPIESLPREPTFNVIREDFPVPFDKAMQPTQEFAAERLTRLAPGGRWIVATEKPEFVPTLRWAATSQGSKVTVYETPVAHEATPQSPHAVEATRFVMVIEKPAAMAPSAPLGWTGPQSKFGDEIGWPKQFGSESGKGAPEIPAERADLGTIRKYGGNEDWARGQAEIYRQIAQKNPNNPTAERRAVWLEQVADRLKNEPPQSGSTK